MSSLTKPPAPATTATRRVLTLAVYDDGRQRGALLAQLNAALPEGAIPYQVEHVKGAGPVQVILIQGIPRSRPEAGKVVAPPSLKATDAGAYAQLAISQGMTLVEFDFHAKGIVFARLPRWTVVYRDLVARTLKCDPWQVEVLPMTDRLGDLERLHILRSPLVSGDEEKRKAFFLDLARKISPSTASHFWAVEETGMGGGVILRRVRDPLVGIRSYPWDLPIGLKTIPFGVREDGSPLSLGLLEINFLLGGTPGGGKSGGITALLAGISRLPHTALIGLDPKMVELAPWRPRFSRIAIHDDDALLVLEQMTSQMEARYEYLAETGRKKFAGDMFSDEFPLLVLVVDELADLVSVGVTKEEKDGDAQRSTRIRRLIAKGRAAGIVVIAATQKPQSDVVPTSLRDLIQLRVCYATTNAAMTETVLGAGMAGNGGLAHEIPAGDGHRGVCFVVSETSRTPIRARTYWVPDEEVPGIAERCAHLRVELPWLPAKSGAVTKPGGIKIRPVEEPIEVDEDVVDMGTFHFDIPDLDTASPGSTAADDDPFA